MSVAENLSTSDAPPAAARRRRPLRRLGCTLLLLIWFVVLLLPCGLFLLAVRGELSLTVGDLPDQELRLWLVMEIDQRGIGTSIPAVYPSGDSNAVCMETVVRYFFWHGEGEAPIVYCECFDRPDAEANWSYFSTQEGNCTR